MSDAQKCLLLIMAVCFISLSFFNGIIITRNSRNNNTITVACLTQHQNSANDGEKSSQKGNMEYITNETYLCNNVTAPRRNLSFIWQPIIPGHSYIYSAHIDNRDDRKMIKVVTILDVNRKDYFNLYCHIWHENAAHVTAVKAEGEPKFENGSVK